MAKKSEVKMPTLDLHGFKVDAVVDSVDRFLHREMQKGSRQVRIITGRGTGAVKAATLDWLKRGGFPYKAENEGSFVIFLE